MTYNHEERLICAPIRDRIVRESWIERLQQPCLLVKYFGNNGISVNQYVQVFSQHNEAIYLTDKSRLYFNEMGLSCDEIYKLQGRGISEVYSIIRGWIDMLPLPERVIYIRHDFKANVNVYRGCVMPRKRAEEVAPHEAEKRTVKICTKRSKLFGAGTADGEALHERLALGNGHEKAPDRPVTPFGGLMQHLVTPSTKTKPASKPDPFASLMTSINSRRPQ